VKRPFAGLRYSFRVTVHEWYTVPVSKVDSQLAGLADSRAGLVSIKLNRLGSGAYPNPACFGGAAASCKMLNRVERFTGLLR
jgi:hypothetical protein